MSLLQDISISVTGKVEKVSDSLAQIVLISDVALRRKYQDPSSRVYDTVLLKVFHPYDEKEEPVKMNDSFVYEEGRYTGVPAKLYELITKIGQVVHVDGDLVAIELTGDMSEAIKDIIYQDVTPEYKKKKIKQLHKGNIRGEAKQGDEVLFTAYKIILDNDNDEKNKVGKDYVILTNRERHFKKKD